MTFEPSDAKSLFLQASELAKGERASFLDRACDGKPELRVRVESLLRSFDEAGSFLANPIGDAYGVTQLAQKSKDSWNAAADKSGLADTEELAFLERCETPGRIGKLGVYEIIEVIGRGGMGVVLKAFDTKLQRIVAVKVLAPQMATSSMAVKRFLREAQAAAAVSHDHVITIFAVEEHEQHPYLVMECIVGQSLQQKIDRSSPLGLHETLRIGMQISSGLAAAHKQGLVHRDVKPANILLENGVERVKLTDFGLARAIDDIGMTQSGQIAGTPQYMSPEQAMGERVDARSDLFSLGSVLYSMCTGRPAFRADSAVAVLRRVCDDTPRPIREINQEVPEWLVEIIDKLLQKKPEDRYQSANEVAEVLSQCLAWQQQPDGPRPFAIPLSVTKPRPGSARMATYFGGTLLVIALVMPTLFGAWWGAFQPASSLFVTNQIRVHFIDEAEDDPQKINDDDDDETDLFVMTNGVRVAKLEDNRSIDLPSGTYSFVIMNKAGSALDVFVERFELWRRKNYRATDALLANHFKLVRGDEVRVFRKLQHVSEGASAAAPDASIANSLIPSLTGDTSRLHMVSVPFSVEKAREQQAAWAEHLQIPAQYSDPIGIQFRLLTPGQFNMGDSFDEVNFVADELKQRGADDYANFAIRSSAPKHRVQLESPFYIAQFETTVAQFQKFVEETGYVSTLENLDPPHFHWKQYAPAEKPEVHPVCGVSWEDAKAFCNWRSEREKVQYDLPTEAQWEFACRAGNDGRWSFGNDSAQLASFAVFGRQQSPVPSPIGTLKPNAFDLYDMHGNVEEWCRDWHQADFYKKSPTVDPVCAGLATDPGSGRVARGGSWNTAAWRTRSSMRMYDFPSIPVFARGFRVVITGDLKTLKETGKNPQN